MATDVAEPQLDKFSAIDKLMGATEPSPRPQEEPAPEPAAQEKPVEQPEVKPAAPAAPVVDLNEINRKIAELGEMYLKAEESQTVTAPADEKVAVAVEEPVYKPFVFDKEVLDPEALKQLSAYQEHVAAELNRLKAGIEKQVVPVAETLTAMQRQQQAAAEAEGEAWFDKHIESLGSEWEDVFGKGPMRNLDENSEFFINRTKLGNGTLALLRGTLATVGKPPTRDKAAEDARSFLFKEKELKQTQKAQAERLRDASGQFIAKPGRSDKSEETSKLDPRTRGIMRLREQYPNFFKSGGSISRDDLGLPPKPKQ